MAKQFELNFNDKTPTFTEWLTATNYEHSRNGEKPYSLEKGVEVYKKLVKSDFFNTCENDWNKK